MTLAPRWECDIESADASVRYSRPGVVCVASAESSHSQTVRILSAATGNERGRIEISGSFNGAVYRDAPGLLFVTTREDDVYAVDPESAEVRWETNAASVGPATAETVYTYGGANVWAHGANDGTREWAAILPDSVSGVRSPDLLGGETLVQVVGDVSDRSLVGIDAESGTERFHHESDAVNEYIVDGQTILALGGEEYEVREVVRIDERTGREQWSHTPTAAGRIDEDAIEVRDDAIYVDRGTGGGITVLNPVTGQVSGTLDGYTGLFFDSARLYSGKESDGGSELHAIDPETRRVAWRTAVDAKLAGVAFDGEEGKDVYLSAKNSDGSGVVYRVNGATGRIRWECPIGETVDSVLADASPILAYSSLHPMMSEMVGADTAVDQSIYAIDRESGRAVWSFSVGNANVGVATDEYVVVPSDGGRYVLDREDGRIELEANMEDAIGDGALFAVTGTTLSAYPLTDAPEAFAGGSGAPEDDGMTAVYGDAAPSTGETNAESADTGVGGAESEATNVTARSEDDGDRVGAPDRTTRVFAGDDADSPSFCPGCGTDLGAHADASFCPDCGTSLTE